MIKYAMKWKMDEKEGVTFYVNDYGKEYKVTEGVFNSIDCPNLGFKKVFYDKEKKTTNVSFGM